ncbi:MULTISPECIES: hypothetical protein [Metabacillus]|uniref:hypothetical protein n=1 Tax=Metabacillus TaxID=2675233 RepID=UPI000C80C7AA|nr:MULTISPECIES: hypothetical protein [Metabacillus]MCM3443554.1 hypothetical protein [Metabacillus halosaccharovorans]PMC35020.1 hypothetical protein CJ195_21180 [Bacillus sp. UMB0899]
MSVEMVANLIPVAAKCLELGIFNKVAVRDVDIKKEFAKSPSDMPVEVLTYYRTLRTSGNKPVTQALHIFLKGNSNELKAFAFIKSHPYKGHVTMGERWIHNSDSPEPSMQSIYLECISFEDLTVFLSNAISKAQEILDITPKKRVEKHFQETVNFLTSLYNNEDAILDLMSVHLSSSTLSFSITCETGWGSDYHFNVTKDRKSVAMKMDIDPREVGIDEPSTFRATEEINSNDSDGIYEAFTRLMKSYGILNS